MAWPVPLVHSAWTGSIYGTAAFVNKFLLGTHMRYKAMCQFSGATPAAYAPLSVGANIQSAHQINNFRPANVSDGVGGFRLRYRGPYLTDPDDTTQASELLSPAFGGTWVHADPAELAIGQAWSASDHVMWQAGDGFGDSFLPRVNGILAGWGLPGMGTTLVSGGGIPWTRKHGSRSSPSTAYGPMEVGDIFGEWLFNEWRAVLECLSALTREPSWTTPADTWYVWETNADGTSTTCADAKSAAEATWENARTRAVSPVTEPPGRAGASGSVAYSPASGYAATFHRTFVQYYITTMLAVDNGLYRLFFHVFADEDFEDFGDGHTEGVIRQINETAGGSAYTLSPAPMKDPATAAGDVNDIPCPTGGLEAETVAAGYYFSEVPGMVCVLTFPEP